MPSYLSVVWRFATRPSRQVRSLCGYVQQDDVLPGTLSVFEYLHFNALLRLPPARWAGLTVLRYHSASV